MAYTLNALVGPPEALGPGGVPLERGLVLVPVTTLGPAGASTPSGEACLFLPPEVRGAAVEASRSAPVAYLEAELWAGEGIQAAIVWADGEVVLGPLTSDCEPGTLAERPINRALRRLGVTRGDDIDEFDAAGLGRHRSTEAWT